MGPKNQLPKHRRRLDSATPFQESAVFDPGRCAHFQWHRTDTTRSIGQRGVGRPAGCAAAAGCEEEQARSPCSRVSGYASCCGLILPAVAVSCSYSCSYYYHYSCCLLPPPPPPAAAPAAATTAPGAAPAAAIHRPSASSCSRGGGGGAGGSRLRGLDVTEPQHWCLTLVLARLSLLLTPPLHPC